MATQSVLVLEGITPDNIPFDDLFALNKPVILKGLVKSWPLVQQGLSSATDVLDSLAKGDSGNPLLVYKGGPDIAGRFGYNDTCTGFNYVTEKARLADVLSQIRGQLSQSLDWVTEGSFGRQIVPTSLYKDQSWEGLRWEGHLSILYNVEGEW